jgi:hypothetical protein
VDDVHFDLTVAALSGLGRGLRRVLGWRLGRILSLSGKSAESDEARQDNGRNEGRSG